MAWIGVDPGKKGALARISESGAIQIERMPMVTGAKGRDEYDLPAISAILWEWYNGTGLVTIEKSQPMPPRMRGGSNASFHRGVARGWEWMCAGMGIPYVLVSPVQWMRIMHIGTPGEDTKQRSILAAQRLFPGVNLMRTERARKSDDAFAEALLLAEFGRRSTRAEKVG